MADTQPRCHALDRIRPKRRDGQSPRPTVAPDSLHRARLTLLPLALARHPDPADPDPWIGLLLAELDTFRPPA
ncbi:MULTISPECIES: hypothetical protein [unclassified Streptomyces]|uniref:hypothetical protein n=1 Tax=unclassified Streptomyces TaxID=2593676 RepID=UPI002E81CF62|nr:hypothetical protein [Streptomyces sp. NBC_00589]WTI38261.1 hypothetical protein OIC96_26355 [Streptomyces sp. NBC_00775]WUB28060.1 hypothetical protein OHA51_23380 [Streptomyces sp. NBC_00589]